MIVGKVAVMPIKVSVIIPVFNMEQFLNECIDRVISQTLHDIEIICINDGSSDKSLDILTQYMNADNRFVILNQENQGPGVARNNGIRSAKGEFIAFMDPDDWYPTSDILSNLYNTAIQNEVNICGGSLSDSLNGIVTSQFEGEWSAYTFDKAGMIRYSDYQFDYGYYRFIYKRKFLLDNRLFFPDYRRFQDPPFFVLSMCVAKEFYAIPQITYCYRKGHQSYDLPDYKLIDAIKGITDNLLISRKYNLEILHKNTVLRLANKNYPKLALKYLSQGNERVLFALISANSAIDIGLLQKSGFTMDDYYIIEPLKQYLAAYKSIQSTNKTVIDKKYNNLLYEFKCVKNSLSYRIGRIITFLPRKIRGGYLCVRDHGLRYTLKYIFKI